MANNYFSPRSFQAMVHCLKQLRKKVHVNFLKSENEQTGIKFLLDQGYKINKIYTNRDYTPFALNRSKAMRQLSKEYNFIYREFDDMDIILFLHHFEIN